MAQEKSKLEVRDLRETDTKPYLTKSNAELDLAARLEADERAGAPGAGGTLTLNPNPVGEKVEGAGTYVGTDPIYQNSSTVHGRPYDSKGDAPEAKVEKVTFDDNDLSDVDDTVKDPGFGGETTKVGAKGGETFRTILPGQEGYDLEKAKEQQGPPLRVYADESPSEGGDNEEEKEEAADPTPSTQPPASPAVPTQSTPPA